MWSQKENRKSVVENVWVVFLQHSVDLITFQDQSKQIETLQREKELLTEDVVSLKSRIDYLQNSTADREVVVRLEAKIRDLEAKLDLEQISHSRAEVIELFMNDPV